MNFTIKFDDGATAQCTIDDNSVTMLNRCRPYNKIKVLKNPAQYLPPQFPDLKIINVYHNPRGGDFVIYENGVINDIYSSHKLGHIISVTAKS